MTGSQDLDAAQLREKINELHTRFDEAGWVPRSGCNTCGWGWPCPTSALVNGTEPYSVSG
jgi:hypothetical protein